MDDRFVNQQIEVRKTDLSGLYHRMAAIVPTNPFASPSRSRLGFRCVCLGVGASVDRTKSLFDVWDRAKSNGSQCQCRWRSATNGAWATHQFTKYGPTSSLSISMADYQVIFLSYHHDLFSHTICSSTDDAQSSWKHNSIVIFPLFEVWFCSWKSLFVWRFTGKMCSSFFFEI